jgi:predicted acetyltransferase
VNLRLRPPRVQDEAEVRAAQDELDADDFAFAFFRPGQSFVEYVQSVEDHRRGRNVDAGWVESSFLLAVVDGAIVGRSSIRHELNEHLLEESGHIGYAVRPAHRRRGYATEILRQSLIIARAVGVERPLVTCDDENVGSAVVIESCGGVLEDIRIVDGVPIRRYWID